jgi:SAM-dependent methyltransferase
MNNGEWSELRAETQRLWEKNAPAWDERMGDAGNDFHQQLVLPAFERLLELRPDQRVLDIGCGNGAVARWLARLGALVTAFDFSPTFVELARARSGDLAKRIDYCVVDATDRQQLLALGEQRFDAAVSVNALMDMAALEPLAEALGRLLRPGGRFVFSIGHPCFQGPGMRRVAEEEDCDGRIFTHRALKVSQYATPAAYRGLGILNQPEPHYYFHRSLSLLLAPFFRTGLALDGLEEPVFPEGAQGRREFSWENYREIPPLLIARLRLRDRMPRN